MQKTFGKNKWSVLVIFGLIGQIAWAVENMYFNLFIYDTISKNLDIIALMVSLSGIAATATTLIAGTISDKFGNRKSFISWGYIIWGITVALFGFISPELFTALFGVAESTAVSMALFTVVTGDCIMTLFGSCANDAAFNAWVTDNTDSSFRGKVESVLSVLPLLSMLIVAGGFGILVEATGYRVVFLALGIVISLSGAIGIFMIKDSSHLEKNGGLGDMLYGFKPSSVKKNPSFYMSLVIMCIYGIACQVFMPYLIIYMKEFLHFTVLEYSIIFGAAILFGAVVNILLGIITDKIDKAKCMYIAAGIFSLGLLLMYLMRGISQTALLISFGIAGFVMIVGYIFIAALSGALVRDYTPDADAGKLQGVRMIFAVLIPMLIGPGLGNAINRAAGHEIANPGADAMTTSFIPAPEIFLVASIISALLFALIPLFIMVRHKQEKATASAAFVSECNTPLSGNNTEQGE